MVFYSESDVFYSKTRQITCSQVQRLFLNENVQYGVISSPSESVALWVVCSLEVARLASVSKFIYCEYVQS